MKTKQEGKKKNSLQKQLVAITNNRQNLDRRCRNQLPHFSAQHDQRHDPVHQRLHVRAQHLVRTRLDHLDHLLARIRLFRCQAHEDRVGPQDQAVEQVPLAVLGVAVRVQAGGARELRDRGPVPAREWVLCGEVRLDRRGDHE